jgi:actin-like ATPase involved in cell morphogenesis
MPKLTIQITDYRLARNYARQILVGSAFAFIAPNRSNDVGQTRQQNFDGFPGDECRTVALFPESQMFPGFKVHTETRPFQLAPVLLPDKEIYRVIHDTVRLLLIAPDWLRANKRDSGTTQQVAQLVIEKNGYAYRRQTVELAAVGLTLVELTLLPEGNYRVYWNSEDAIDYQGNKAECRFSIVEYVLSPLQATLLTHELQGSSLNCRLQVDRFNEPFNEPVLVELWSERRLGQQQLAPIEAGIYHANFSVDLKARERLELRAIAKDQVATVVIPGSRRVERDETILSRLGRQVGVSLMPSKGARAVRGLYLSKSSIVINTPVTIVDPAPANRRSQLRWMVAAQAARLLVLDLQGNVVEHRDLGDVVPKQEIEIEVPAPGGLLAIAAWVGDNAWEGWSTLLASDSMQLEVTSPATARPASDVELNLSTDKPAAVYVRVRDTRLSGATPQQRLAASLKQGFQGVLRWATLGYIKQNLAQHPDWWQFGRGGIVVAIDLGMTRSSVAVVLGGQPTVIANAEGRYRTPCVVAYTSDGTCLVGETAKRQAFLNPENTFDSLKRFIGRKYDEVVDEATSVSYEVLNVNGNVKLNCPILGQQLAPEEILAEVLHQLIEDASEYLGEQVTQAVITVPPYFQDSQRQAIKDAGKIARLDVLRIINEPTAACLAHGLDKKDYETILVFDLGGSRLDVSILEAGDGVFEVLATSGDAHVGGDEFDKKIVDYIAAEFYKASGVDLRQDKQALYRLSEAAEQAKIELSSVTSVKINLPTITSTEEGSQHLEITLTREQFEELCSDLIDRCRLPIEIALRDGKISKNDINEVVLVGGSTRIPAVQALVRQMLGKEPQQSINPDEVVALGASIQASVLGGEVGDILLLDDIPGLRGATTLNPAPRSDFADIAYCGIVHTNELGKASLSFRLPDAIASYNIEAFALSESGTEWCSDQKRLDVSKPVWAEFKLAKFIYPGDKSPATVDVSCASGQFRLRLLCDGVSVPFSVVNAEQTAPDIYTGQRAKVMFEAHPGQWRVEVEDLITQECDISERTVAELGRFKGLARRFQLLLAGETLDRQTHKALQLQLLPSLEKPFNLLCDATANYEHHCCEQTAAKLLAAVASLIAGGDSVKLRDVILAGVAREQRMHLPGRGLALYPPEEMGGMADPDDLWGKIAAEHLCGLSIVGKSVFTVEATQSDPEMQQALQIAIAIGEDAAFAYKLPLVPTQIENGRDAYRALMRSSPIRDQALPYARRSLQRSIADHQMLQGAVLSRTEQAYCAAALLMGSNESDRALAVATTNQLANSLDSHGRLYSTVDSVALIGLMTAMRSAGIGLSGTVRVLLNGRLMSLAEAMEVSSTSQIDAIAVLEGAVLVELTTEVVEDWNAFRADVPVQIQLVAPQERANGFLRQGDTIELVVEVERYEPGLLAHVCLPPALSRLEGGGEVKRFSVDFCGRSLVQVPLFVSSHTLLCGEHWAVVVSNMFSEERTGNPGLLRVQVSSPE